MKQEKKVTDGYLCEGEFNVQSCTDVLTKIYERGL